MKDELYKTDIIEYINVNLERVSKTLATFFKKQHNLSQNQMSALWYLGQNGQMTMGQLTDKLSMSKQQGTQLVELLVQRGLLNREYPRENRRVIHVNLSDKGIEVIASIEQAYYENAMREISMLSENEQVALMDAIRTINHVLPKLHLGADKELNEK